MPELDKGKIPLAGSMNRFVPLSSLAHHDEAALTDMPMASTAGVGAAARTGPDP
jgi:hypothetical protein